MESNNNNPRGGGGRQRPTGVTVVTNNPVQIAPGIQKINTTRVMYTINTNTMHLTQGEIDAYGAHFMSMIDALYDDGESGEEVFGASEYVDWEVNGNPSVEIGDKFHRTHVHFNVTIRHALPNYSVRKLSERLKQFLDDFTPPEGQQQFRHAVFARLNGWDENYANKYQRWAANANAPTDEEAQRLSEEDTQVTRTAVVAGRNVTYKVFARNPNVFEGRIRKYNL